MKFIFIGNIFMSERKTDCWHLELTLWFAYSGEELTIWFAYSGDKFFLGGHWGCEEW